MLVRHGQASFGAADYDQLSPLGEQQCHALGSYLAQRARPVQAVWRGTLRRHAQSLAALEDGWRAAGGPALPAATPWPGLNEYDGDALARCGYELAGAVPEPGTGPAQHRAHFRALRQGMLHWMAGEPVPGVPLSYADWVAGIVGALDAVRQQHTGEVLMVTSGGPIATAVGQVLQTPAATTIELNLRIRNSALTELTFTPSRHQLLTFNQLPHLDSAERADWVTYT